MTTFYLNIKINDEIHNVERRYNMLSFYCKSIKLWGPLMYVEWRSIIGGCGHTSGGECYKSTRVDSWSYTEPWLLSTHCRRAILKHVHAGICFAAVCTDSGGLPLL